MPPRAHAQDFGLYARDGARKYLNQAERQRFLSAATRLETSKALLAFTVALTGARISEALALVPLSFDLERGVVALWTLKRRRPHIRELPIPAGLMSALDRFFGIAARQQDPSLADQRLWPWHRVTAYRFIRSLSESVGIAGCRGTPRGLRHGFAISAIVDGGVPLNLAQRWLGHARMETTAIYGNACGPEERLVAERFWAKTKGDCGLLAQIDQSPGRPARAAHKAIC